MSSDRTRYDPNLALAAPLTPAGINPDRRLESLGPWTPDDEFYTEGELNHSKDGEFGHHSGLRRWKIVLLPQEEQNRFFIRTKDLDDVRPELAPEGERRRGVYDWTQKELETANITQYVRSRKNSNFEFHDKLAMMTIIKENSKIGDSFTVGDKEIHTYIIKEITPSSGVNTVDVDKSGGGREVTKYWTWRELLDVGINQHIPKKSGGSIKHKRKRSMRGRRIRLKKTLKRKTKKI